MTSTSDLDAVFVFIVEVFLMGGKLGFMFDKLQVTFHSSFVPVEQTAWHYTR